MNLTRLVPAAIRWRINVLRARLDPLRDMLQAARAARRLEPRAARILQDLKSALRAG